MEPFTSALELACQIRDRELSPLEAVDACLERVDQLNPEINAIVWRDDEGARAAALEAERALADGGEGLPPFHGVPIPIKDLTAVEGWPVTYGSHGAHGVPSADSELVVRALQRAGFVLCGRTNTPEFGPITATENLRYGATRNPWDTTRTPGGSSGGAGAAVASGMFPIAHANDGGGSIRIPAGYCGLVGLKPSRGRVPRLAQSWEGAVVEGVVSRTVADTAVVLDAIARPDPGSWYNAPLPERPYADELERDPGSLRIALATRAPLGLPIEPSCMEAARATAAMLEQLGHQVEETDFVPWDETWIEPFIAVVTSGFADYPDVDWDKVEPHNRVGRERGQQVDAIAYVQASQALQRLSRAAVSHWGSDFDLLLTPTSTIEPPTVGTVLEAAHANPGEPVLPVLQMIAFNAFGNITGLPGISLPLHWTEAGLPLGVQLVGGPWDEATLIRVGAQLEQARPWRDRRPPESVAVAAA